MGDIKTLLKDAREAIKNKDYEGAILLCKDVLKQDEKNYLALVFLGLSFQECGALENSEKSFRKAIEINSDNLLAWNGLANFYEKQDTTDSKLELIKIYTNLIGKESNEKKLLEYCDKLCNLYKYTDAEEICRTIYDRIENGNYSEETIVGSCTSLVNVLNKSNNLSEEIIDVYEDILTNLLKNGETRTLENYLQYLSLLYKRDKTTTLIDETRKMWELYPDDCKTLTWICKLFQKFCKEKRENLLLEVVDVEKTCEKLLELSPDNYNALVAKGLCLTRRNEYYVAREVFKAATEVKPSSVEAWILRTKIAMLLHLGKEAIESAEHARTLDSFSGSKFEIDCLLMECLSKSTESADWTKAVSLYQTFDEKSRMACRPHLTRANIRLGDDTKASGSLTELEAEQSEPELTTILSAQLFRNQKKYSHALAILEMQDSQTAETYLEIGKCYLEMGELEKCLMPLLKSAKADPNNYECFLWLGHYYRKNKDLNQARRCYEKAFNLCPGYPDAAIALTMIYRQLKNWDANYALLRTIGEGTIGPSNSWAFLQLGLNYLEQGIYDKAIDNLRLVLRVDPANSYCWESLADCYLSRGAFTSAMKAYEKVLELSNDVLYSRLQLASIKKDLGLYDEAIKNFESILVEDEDNMLCRYGLAETYLRKARECYRDHRLGTARDCVQNSVENLSIAIQQYSEISCLWKLLADCCLFVASLPDKFCCLLILKSLDQGLQAEGKQILEQDELFQFAARCYCKSLLLIEDNALIWHDLARCYLMRAKASNDETIILENLERSLAIARHCAHTDATHWQHWNLLGVVAARLPQPNYALAQHAFIMAVTICNNSAVSWTNLGVVYLMLQDIKLANEAFAQAQRADPDYAESWIGQAMLAEMLDREEAMDLFRHSAQLGHHQQAALGYGHWVCKMLLISQPEAVSEYMEKTHAVPVACDCLTWYTELNPYNPCAWNMLGLLRERMGLIKCSGDAYRKALDLSPSSYSDLASINYARVLTKTGRYKEAIRICDNVSTSSFNIGIWYALALYKDHQLSAAFSIYLAIEQHLAQDKYSLGDIVACMAIIKYVLGESELAKKTIIKSFTQRLPTAQVMYALIALGVLQNDTPLVTFTLKQVEVLGDITESIEDFVALMSYVHILQGNCMKAIQKVSKLVHSLPNKSTLWLSLCLALLHSRKQIKLPAESAIAARKCALLALEMNEASATHQKMSQIHCAVSTSSLLSNQKRSALVAAQKAVHCSPNAIDCWTVLGEALDPNRYRNIEDIFNPSNEAYRHIQCTKVF